MEQLRKQELKGADYIKIDKSKKDIEKLESMMTVATQAIETTSAEIIRVREIELYPQLIELVKGLVNFNLTLVFVFLLSISLGVKQADFRLFASNLKL